MKILAFCFFPAYTPPGSGGESRLFNFYRHLSRFHQVTLLTSIGPHDVAQTVHHGAGFTERRIPKDEYFLQQWQTLSPLGSGADLSAPCLAACGTSPTGLHQAYLEEYDDADVIIHDFPFTIDYDLFLGLDKKLRVYNAHNCETRLYASLHPAEKSQPIRQLVRDVESRLLKHADMVLYCSDDDLTDFRSLVPDEPFEAVYAPHGIEPIRLPNRVAHTNQPFRAFFIGSAHPPNQVAAQFIVEKLAPALPHVLFDIVGHCLPEGKYPANIHRHGVVDEPTKVRLMARANVALNPMEEGSGANIKVLDYLGAGLPVISTPFGMRGVQANEHTEYCCASLEGFATTLTELAQDPERCWMVGKAGYRFVQNSHTWTSIASKVADALSLAAHQKAGQAPRCLLALNDYDSFASVSGGGTRTKGLYQAVSDWLPVVFLCFSSENQLAVRHEAPGIVVITVPKSAEHQQKQAWYAARFSISVDDVVASHYCTENFFLNAIYRVLRQWASSVVIEHCYMLPLPVQYGDRFVYSSHNNETHLKTALLRGHPDESSLVERVDMLERYAIENAALTVCVSLDDAVSMVQGKAGAAPTVVIRNGASEPADAERVRMAQKQLMPAIGPRSAVFIGSAHGPNIEAARQLINHVVPHCPDVQFHFVGSVCASISSKGNNIHLWGEVDDAKKCAILQSCGVALNPVLSGGGSNIKIADYIANGLFVITTEFGLRGYPEALQRHVTAVDVNAFPQAIERCLNDGALHTDEAKLAREADFRQHLAMKGLGNILVQQLKALEVPRKRILFVAPRYVAPTLDDGERYRDQWLRELVGSGYFDIDVVAPDCGQLNGRLTFSDQPRVEASCSALVNVPHLRFARFQQSAADQQALRRARLAMWETQLQFEQTLSHKLVPSDGAQAGLTWGWGDTETQGDTVVRWAMTACAMHVPQEARVVMHGQASTPMSIAVSNNGLLIEHRAVSGSFTLDLHAQAGELVFTSSSAQLSEDQPLLAFTLMSVTIGNHVVEASSTVLWKQSLDLLEANDHLRFLDHAASATRDKVNLTALRGPSSRGLEAFIQDNVASYDLVIAWDNSFRPAVFALKEAKKCNVPSILMSNIDLTDDFYHFPDLRQSEEQAGLVVVSSEAVAEFLRSKGCNVLCLPAALDDATSSDQTLLQHCIHMAAVSRSAQHDG